MKLRLLAAALVLTAAFAMAARADDFSELPNRPGAYWVPATVGYAQPPGYYPPGYYGNPPPVVIYAPPPPPPPVVGGIFFHFHIH